jgi:hypothetical protein
MERNDGLGALADLEMDKASGKVSALAEGVGMLRVRRGLRELGTSGCAKQTFFGEARRRGRKAAAPRRRSGSAAPAQAIADG